MRRILFPLLVIGLAGGLFTLGSGAFFSDSETDTGNTITAGTLTLDVTSPFATVACSSMNLTKPGDGPATCTNTVQNSGSITGDLYLKVTYNNTADLGAVLTVAGGSSNTGTGANTAAGTTWGGNTTWKTLALACVNVAELGAGETFISDFPTTFASSAGNAYQGATAQLVFRYVLMQAGATPTDLAGCNP